MGYTVTYTPLNDYLLAAYNGEADGSTLLENFNEWMHELAQSGSKLFIADLSSLIMTIPMIDLVFHAKHMRDSNDIVATLRIAVIYSEQNKNTLLAFETAASNRSITFRAFPNLEKAEQWLLR